MNDPHKKRSFKPWGSGMSFYIIVLVVFSSLSLFAFRDLYTGNSNEFIVTGMKKLPPLEIVSDDVYDFSAISIQETVYFQKDAIVFLNYPPSTAFSSKNDINCIYLDQNSKKHEQKLTPLSVKDYENQQIVRCPLPTTSGTILTVQIGLNDYLTPARSYQWDSLAYEALIDRDNSTIVFVKGLGLVQTRAGKPSRFKCLYGSDLSNQKLVLHADVISVAQEIVRCKTPLSILNNPEQFDSIKVTVRVVGQRTISSVARLKRPFSSSLDDKKVNMCVCTTLKNQAQFLPEWIMYHSSIGVDRWFLYDNNSDDDTEEVIESLVSKNYNVSRHVWPWMKTQEASFSHCALRARDSCEWVGFIDVDEFLYLQQNQSLTNILKKNSKVSGLGELRISCNDFGPSGLKESPKKGVMAGYTCRMRNTERHKSIVKPEALSDLLSNVIHHFRLKSGFWPEYMKRSDFVINHYKYQVWDIFKEKYSGRAATYVDDWTQKTNLHSKDRTPGLSTEPIEPSDWSTSFCEVKDTGLRDRVLETLALSNGMMLWE